MKNVTLVIALVFFEAIVFTSCTDNKNSSDANIKQAVNTEDLVTRGEYLVNTIGCNDCHSPKKMGAQGPEIIPELKLSGYPADRPLGPIDANVLKSGWGMFNSDLTCFVGPWGASFAANITSDVTGIGTWTEEQFKKALTQGKFKGLDGSRTLLPPMPWPNWVNMKDEDIKAIFAYLKSTPPVRNVVPEPITPDKF